MAHAGGDTQQEIQGTGPWELGRAGWWWLQSPAWPVDERGVQRVGTALMAQWLSLPLPNAVTKCFQFKEV